MSRRPFNGLPSVGGLADHGDARLGVEDHPQPGADDFLVIRDEHPDGHVTARHVIACFRGKTALTAQPWPGLLGPASQLPPSRRTRSIMPVRP